MRIICISDTHDRQHAIALPDGDVLIHAGDLTMHGETEAIFEGFAWLSKQPHERIIFTPGNHDFGFQRIPHLVDALKAQFPRVETLIDQGAMVNGLRVYGSPWQPWFHDWAYNFQRGAAGERQAREKWGLVPDDTDILITHGPVYKVLDTTLRGEHAGCPMLRQRISRLANLRLHVCGHIHESYGAIKRDGVLFVNACSCDAQYLPSQNPIVIEWNDGNPGGASLPNLKIFNATCG